MERLQGPINPSWLIEDHLGCLEEENSSNLGLSYGQLMEDYNSTEEQTLNPNPNAHFIHPSFEEKMSFLQMLQSVETPIQFQEPNFQFFLRFQQYPKRPLFVSSEIMELQRSENVEMGVRNVVESVNLRSEIKQNKQVMRTKHGKVKAAGSVTTPAPTRERRKRKRTLPVKNKEEVENQRMTHIAVERNRRRQMNDHLNALRSLMPPSYIQRGDQASIIGGAIDFVKELEQLLHSLQAQKRMRSSSEDPQNGTVSATSSTSSSPNFINNFFMGSPFQLLKKSTTQNQEHQCNNGPEKSEEKSNNNGEEMRAERRTEEAEIEVVVIHKHVNMKVECERREGQLVKAILALEELKLSVLHLNVTSLLSLVHYSFNLKIEEECKLGTAEEVARAVHHIFTLINSSSS